MIGPLHSNRDFRQEHESRHTHATVLRIYGHFVAHWVGLENPNTHIEEQLKQERQIKVCR